MAVFTIVEYFPRQNHPIVIPHTYRSQMELLPISDIQKKLYMLQNKCEEHRKQGD